MRPLYKKDDRKEKSNYRPVSILSNVSKVYERGLCDQIYDFFENKFSSYQCGFRKGFNTQNELLSMVEDAISPWQKRSLWGNIDWSVKSFALYSHDLLTAKLNACGFDHNALNVIHNYLFGRSQKAKVGSSFRDLLDILNDVPQGSILGPLHFSI